MFRLSERFQTRDRRKLTYKQAKKEFVCEIFSTIMSLQADAENGSEILILKICQIANWYPFRNKKNRHPHSTWQKITVSTTRFGKSTLIGKIFAKTILGAPISNWGPR